MWNEVRSTTHDIHSDHLALVKVLAKKGESKANNVDDADCAKRSYRDLFAECSEKYKPGQKSANCRMKKVDLVAKLCSMVTEPRTIIRDDSKTPSKTKVLYSCLPTSIHDVVTDCKQCYQQWKQKKKIGERAYTRIAAMQPGIFVGTTTGMTLEVGNSELLRPLVF